MSLTSLCWPCAKQLSIDSTLLPSMPPRNCDGCGARMGERRERGTPYCIQWTNHIWPVAWGITIQDRYGSHVHEWRTTYADFRTGARREDCRCGESRAFAVRPTAAAPPAEKK